MWPQKSSHVYWPKSRSLKKKSSSCMPVDLIRFSLVRFQGRNVFNFHNFFKTISESCFAKPLTLISQMFPQTIVECS